MLGWVEHSRHYRVGGRTDQLSAIAVQPGDPRHSAAEAHRRRAELAIILPAWNEKLTIAGTIEAFHRARPDATIVVVDNNSTDGTGDIARSTMLDLGCNGVLLQETRQGKGYAVRRAFLEIDADLFVMVDADATYPADQLPQLLEPIYSGRADMVVGDRLAEGRYRHENKRPFHDVGNRVVLTLVNFLFRTHLHDIMSGFRAFDRYFVKNYPVMADGFELETDMTLHALDKRFRIVEVPIAYRDRPPGSISKLSTVRDGVRVLTTIVNVLRYYRPMFFFGWLAVALCGLGLLAGAPVLMDWIQYQYIFRVPLAILATGLIVLASGSLGVGLILDSYVRHQRMSYERSLLRYTDGR
jgi:glycosyltransferase involved in cell wall biosynthesis